MSGWNANLSLPSRTPTPLGPRPLLENEQRSLLSLCKESDKNWYIGHDQKTYGELAIRMNEIFQLASKPAMAFAPSAIIAEIAGSFHYYLRREQLLGTEDENTALEPPNYAPYTFQTGRRREWQQFEDDALVWLTQKYERIKAKCSRQETIASEMNKIAESRSWPTYSKIRSSYTYDIVNNRLRLYALKSQRGPSSSN